MDDFMEINESIVVNNATEEVPDRNVFILPWWQQLIWTLIFGSMIFVATGGNVIVMWIVLAHKRMRSVTNYFLVNLSFADTMVSTLNVIFNFIYMLDGHWPFGEAYCKISNFIAIVSVAASVFTLMAISIDRQISGKGKGGKYVLAAILAAYFTAKYGENEVQRLAWQFCMSVFYGKGISYKWQAIRLCSSAFKAASGRRALSK
ncbi:tachykinin-like peptides receptor 99D [Nephila pilipes]|uniref:Tachykinin-like peptides receptor 99D n=1 Tax=Nephila pilipes TaxID=299642 RepID=A0A8X6R352_NEPPI|nr:tachykinin-like peptides receptor 99D [Nephila pilipes]